MMNVTVGMRPGVAVRPASRQAVGGTGLTFSGTQKPKSKAAAHQWAIMLTLAGGLLAGGVGLLTGTLSHQKAGQPVAVKGANPQAAEKEVVHVNDVNFEKEVLKSDVPVLVTFGAKWCGPCQRMAPELKKLANDADLKDKIKVVKIDIDESPNTTAQYSINDGIPDTRFFKKQKAGDKENSQVDERHIGYRNKEQLKTWVNKYLPSKK